MALHAGIPVVNVQREIAAGKVHCARHSTTWLNGEMHSLNNTPERPSVIHGQHATTIWPCATDGRQQRVSGGDMVSTIVHPMMSSLPSRPCCSSKRNTINSIASPVVASSLRTWIASSHATTSPLLAVPSVSYGRRSASICRVTSYATCKPQKVGAQKRLVPLCTDNYRLCGKDCYPHCSVNESVGRQSYR